MDTLSAVLLLAALSALFSFVHLTLFIRKVIRESDEVKPGFWMKF